MTGGREKWDLCADPGWGRTRWVMDRSGVEAMTEGLLKMADPRPLISIEDERPCEGVGAVAPAVRSRGFERGVDSLDVDDGEPGGVAMWEPRDVIPWEVVGRRGVSSMSSSVSTRGSYALRTRRMDAWGGGSCADGVTLTSGRT